MSYFYLTNGRLALAFCIIKWSNAFTVRVVTRMINKTNITVIEWFIGNIILSILLVSQRSVNKNHDHGFMVLVIECGVYNSC